MKSRGLLFAVIPLALVVGCGSSGGAKPTVVQSNPTVGPSVASSPTPKATPVAKVSLIEYVKDIASSDQATIQKAYALASPGSPAELYAEYQFAAQQAQDSAGSQVTASLVTQAAGGYSLCDVVQGVKTCVAFTNFEVAPSGKIVSFSTAGESITTRLVKPGATGASDGLTAKLVAAYRSGQGKSSLDVEITLTNASGATINIPSSSQTYQGPDDVIVTAILNITGPNALPAGATGRYSFYFQNAVAGGSMDIKSYDAAYSPRPDLSLKIG